MTTPLFPAGLAAAVRVRLRPIGHAPAGPIGFVPPERDCFDLMPDERARLEEIRQLRRLAGPAVKIEPTDDDLKIRLRSRD